LPPAECGRRAFGIPYYFVSIFFFVFISLPESCFYCPLLFFICRGCAFLFGFLNKQDVWSFGFSSRSDFCIFRCFALPNEPHLRIAVA